MSGREREPVTQVFDSNYVALASMVSTNHIEASVSQKGGAGNCRDDHKTGKIVYGPAPSQESGIAPCRRFGTPKMVEFTQSSRQLSLRSNHLFRWIFVPVCKTALTTCVAMTNYVDTARGT